MIIPDVNVLVYAHDSTSPRHLVAKSWFENALRGSEDIGFLLVVALGFVRLLSNPKIVLNPIAPMHLVSTVESWLQIPNARMIQPGMRHFELMQKLFAESQAGTNLITDVHIAAAALEHNATLVSNDTDFRRFAGVKIFNPFV